MPETDKSKTSGVWILFINIEVTNPALSQISFFLIFSTAYLPFNPLTTRQLQGVFKMQILSFSRNSENP